MDRFLGSELNGTLNAGGTEAVMHSIQPHGIDPIIPWNQKEVLRIMSKLLIWTLVGNFCGSQSLNRRIGKKGNSGNDTLAT